MKCSYWASNLVINHGFGLWIEQAAQVQLAQFWWPGIELFFLLLDNTVLFHRLVNNSICPPYCTNCSWEHVCVACSGGVGGYPT